jgi:hypothetical protein
MRKLLLTLTFLFLLAPLGVSADEGGRSIAVLLDISKSIPAADFQTSKKVIQDLVQETGATDSISVYVFGEGLHMVTPGELDKLKRTASHTLLYDAMYDVGRALADQKAARKAIVVLSDGLDTKSATILEDTAGFAVSHHIPVYAVGIGTTPSRSLERIVKLTGGQHFSLRDKNIAYQISAAVDAQKPIPPEEPAAAAAPTAAPQPQAAEPSGSETPKPAAAPEPTEQPAVQEEEASGSSVIYWILGGLVGLVFLALIIYAVSRVIRRERRVCPVCGRELEDYQTICPSCTTAVRKKEDQPPADSTQEIAATMESEGEDEQGVRMELLEKKPVGEEVLTKTFVLMEAPVLVVRKGKNLGQAFALNKAYPVSIGRSRVNEIRLDDMTISGQHCRIIPENGKHVLYDLGSTNGTFINEKRVKRAVLNEGDIVKIGETQFLFKVEQQRN